MKLVMHGDRNPMMIKRKFLLFLAIIYSIFVGGIAYSAEATNKPPVQEWSWTGGLSSYDKASAQRGFQVYTEVCASCHSLDLLAFRHLSGIGYTQEQIKSFARQYEVDGEPNEAGEVLLRKAEASDVFPNPYSNEQEARYANNGAFPPDLSIIVKSRAHGEGNFFTNFGHMISGRGSASGADYIYGLLTGYEQEPDGMIMGSGMYYNNMYSGFQIAMPEPLADGFVEYSDGTIASKEQMARDVTTFLAWIAEPTLEERRSLGIKVMLFLLVLLVLSVMAKRRIWSRVH